MVLKSEREFLTRDRIAEVAFELVEEHGLEQLSLREIAKRLSVTPMALYRHIRDKRELESLVVSALLDRSLQLPAQRPAESWIDRVRGCATEIYRALGEHPRMLLIFVLYPYHDRSQLLGRAIADALARGGYPEAEAWEIFDIIGGYIAGAVLVEEYYAKGRSLGGAEEVSVGVVRREATSFAIGLERLLHMIERDAQRR